jgi:hypothetical protein
MPKIPFAPGQVQAEGAKIQHVDQSGAAIAQMGAIITREAQEWDRSISAARDASETAAVETQIVKNSIARAEQYDGRDDFGNFLPTLKEDHVKETEQLRAMVTNPGLWNKLQPHIMKSNLAETLHVKQLARKKQIEAYQTTYIENSEFLSKGIETAPDDETAKYYSDQLINTTRENIRTGIVNPTALSTANKTVERAMRERLMGRIDMLINDNPEVAFASLRKKDEAGNFTEFPDLIPEDRAKKIAHAENAYYVKQSRLEKVERELREDVNLDFVQRLNVKNPDYAGIRRDLEKGTQRDPITGIRSVNASTYQAVNHEIERQIKGGTEKEIKTDNAVYWQLLKGITAEGGSTVTGEDVLAKSGRMSRGDTQELLRAVVSVGKKATKDEAKEEKLFNTAKKDLTQKLLTHVVDTTIPPSGETREANGLVSRRIQEYADLVVPSGDITKDLKKIEDYANELTKWGKEEKKRGAKYMMERVLTPLSDLGWKSDMPNRAAKTQTESEIRAQLTAKGITDKAKQDEWVAKYRASGIIK